MTEGTRISLPEAVNHSLKLSNGRNLSYFTFATTTNSTKDASHPVLYFHGFPGCGLEGAVAAQQLADCGGCQVFAIDRPGFGRSDPPMLSKTTTTTTQEDLWIEAVLDAVWELILHKKWTAFSVLGVSGGGPYTLAMIKSHLGKQEEARIKGRDPNMIPRLVSAAICAGIYGPAGSEGMMPENEAITKVANSYATSWTSRLTLGALTWIQSLTIQAIPASVATKILPDKIPEADKAVIRDPVIGPYFIRCVKYSLGQAAVSLPGPGRTPMVQEMVALFRQSCPSLEVTLQTLFDDNYLHAPSLEFPRRIGIFHGKLDKNVPYSHSEYIHDKVFHGKARFVTYPELGHISLLTEKMTDVARFLAPSYAGESTGTSTDKL